MRRPIQFLLAVLAAFLVATANVAASAPVAAAWPAARLVLPAPKPGRVRPLIAVIADNAGAETTDFTVPYAVLKESGAADVISLSSGPGPVQLVPALRIKTDRTFAEFDASTPRGADIVIVPAMLNDMENSKVVNWVRSQYGKGATVVSICAGAFIVARAGLLEGKHATSHWHSLGDLKREFPRTVWVRDRRYVQDGRVISTTGVSASIPVSLALVEAIAGQPVAARTARRLGVADWSPAHRTADFSLTFNRVVTVSANVLAFWRHETVEAPVANGFDELGLALSSDVWTQSFMTKVETTNAGSAMVRSRRGLVLLPDARPLAGKFVLPAYSGQSLDRALDDIDRRYGRDTADFAALSLEYPWR